MRGAREIEGASASEAPQKRQNCEVGSFPPRQRGQRRSIASGEGVPRSTTRAGAMGDCAVVDRGSKAGGRIVVGDTSIGRPAGGALASVGPTGELRVGGTAANGNGGGKLGGASKCPQVTQKRKLRGLRWPQRGHAASCDAPAVASAALVPVSRSTGATKFTSGAGGRCGTSEGGRGGCEALASMRAPAGPGDGAERPVIGVAGAPRDASL